MSVLEYLDVKGVRIDDHEERMWWIGWEDAHCMGRAYDGWKELRGDDRYEKFAALVCDYLVYCKNWSESLSVLDFIVIHSGQAMSLRYDECIDISKFVVPKVGGYKYVAPVVGDEVVDAKPGAAPSDTGGVVVESELMKKKKSELLEMLGDDGDGRLSKAELVELIVNKLKK